MGGQTLNDRILAAKHSLAGQGLAKAVCKATTEELIGPKKKHLDYLLHCTEEPNVSIPTLANLLIERAQSPNWIVVFKSLVTIHHLMCYGNERFVQYLASSNTSFQLSNFLDKGGVQGYDMSPFVRRYAKYLTEKYFDMNKKNAREALDSYKKFLIRMDRVAEFLKVAENVGVDKGEVPELSKAPSSLLEALESHLANLEGRKVGSPSATTPTGRAVAASSNQNEKLTQQLIKEEEEAMAKYKEQQKASNPFANPFSSSADNGTAAAPAASNATPNILDLFGMPDPAPSAAAPVVQSEPASNSADLLQLSGANPFANVLNAGSATTAPAPVPQNAFASGATPGANFFGDILQPQGSNQANSKQGLVAGDLDASIANLTGNLNLAGGHGNNRSSVFAQSKGPPMAQSQFGNQNNLFGSTLQPQPVMFNMSSSQAK